VQLVVPKFLQVEIYCVFSGYSWSYSSSHKKYPLHFNRTNGDDHGDNDNEGGGGGGGGLAAHGRYGCENLGLV
jgi:hypothetical protein